MPKQTTAPKGDSKMKTAPAQPAAATGQPATTAETLSPRPHQGLTLRQEELCELCSDLLLRGGSRPDVDLLLKALGRHEYRRFASRIDYFPTEDEVRQRGDDGVDKEYRALAAVWPNPEAKKPTSEAPKTSGAVGDIARAGIRAQLQEHFDAFMCEPGVEAQWFLNEVLMYIDSGDDMAQAFARVAGIDYTYVRVPYDFADKTRKFVELLEKKNAA